MPGSAQQTGGAQDPAALTQVVARWLEDRGIRRTGLLIGVSGGADSVGLMRAIDACRGELALDVCVAHLDHSLRSNSAEDANWVQEQSHKLGLGFVTERIDVGRLATEAGRGIEETARHSRLDFFRRAAAERGSAHVAVAHTADDQAETILHHLIRGTGLAGLRGMPETRPLSPQVTLARPLLAVSRADVLQYLDERGQVYRRDETNDDERFTRNRLRRTLLPLLKEQFNPHVSEALARLGRQAAEVQQLIEEFAAQLLATSINERTAERVVFNTTVFHEVAPHLVRESFRMLWIEQNWAAQKMGFDDWHRLAVLAQSAQASGSLCLPHRITASRSGTRVELTRSPSESAGR
ncbi:MAG: tRNA lysidine(34) synthetase TilS [Planctomycetaceae bacterium]